MWWNLRCCLVHLRRSFHTLRCRNGAKLAPIAMALVLTVGLVHMLNTQLRPILEVVVSSQATTLMTQTISAAVDDCLADNHMSYGDFVTLQTDLAGRVTSLMGNTVATSQFKRQVIDVVTERMKGLDREELEVPLGNLTGQLLLSGLGPSIRVEVYSVGSVTADYSSTFTSAGVNQTLHKIDLNITVQVYLVLPGEILPVTVSNTIRVAESVIVGAAPNTYLNLEKGSD